MDRTQAAKDFYESELSNPYSKQSETAAFHLLGLKLDSMEARYDGNSGAVGDYCVQADSRDCALNEPFDPFAES